MVARRNQVFVPHPVPNNVDDNRVLANWIALQFRDMGNYIQALEERIRPAVFWATLTDQSITTIIPFQVWPVDTIIRDDVGAGDYQVGLAALCLGTGGQTEVQFGVSVDLTSPIVSSAIIPLKNGEELYLSLDLVIPQARTLVLWIRGENVDVSNASVIATRIGG